MQVQVQFFLLAVLNGFFLWPWVLEIESVGVALTRGRLKFQVSVTIACATTRADRQVAGSAKKDFAPLLLWRCVCSGGGGAGRRQSAFSGSTVCTRIVNYIPRKLCFGLRN